VNVGERDLVKKFV